MGWNAMAAAGDTRVGSMLVAPYAGTLRQKSTVDLDIIDGGTVSVTAWQKAGKSIDTEPLPRSRQLASGKVRARGRRHVRGSRLGPRHTNAPKDGRKQFRDRY